MDGRIEDLPLSELQADRAESLVDMQMCRVALLHGITEYSNGCDVRERLETNERIVAIIDAELARRKEATDASTT